MRLRSAGEEPEDEVGLNNVLGHDGNIKAIIMKHPMKLLWCCIGAVSCMVIRTPPPPWGRGGRGRGKLWAAWRKGAEQAGTAYCQSATESQGQQGEGKRGSAWARAQNIPTAQVLHTGRFLSPLAGRRGMPPRLCLPDSKHPPLFKI